MIHHRLLAATSAVLLAASLSALVPTLATAQAAPGGAEQDDVTDALRAEARNRWAALGFRTEVVRPNGVDIHVAMAGDGPAVVLLHGYPQSGEIWRDVAPELAESYQVIIPDLRGMGLSGTGTDDHRVLAAAEDVRALLRDLGIEEAQVVGHDWGGAVGATLALAYPETVTRLAFIESALLGAGFEDGWRFDQPNPAFTFIPFLLMEGASEELVAGREEVLLRHLWGAFTSDQAALTFAKWAPYVDAMKRPGLFSTAADYCRDAYDSAADTRRLLEGGKLTIPVLSVGGERSIGASQEGLVRNFADDVVRAIVLPGAGHFIAEERPAELLAALGDFLER